MKKYLNILCTASIVVLSFYQLSAQCEGRYNGEIFSTVTVDQDIQYGEALNENGLTEALTMDVYHPQGDTATNRPLVILCHGGTFYGGTKEDGDIVAACQTLSKMGYVTASLNYRLTSPLNLVYAQLMIKEVIRAVQDGKAAVRYFRKDAATGNTYKINPDAIFFGGSSAGGVLAYQLAYMTDTNELFPSWKTYVNELGGLEGNSGNAGYSSEVQGAIGYAGAIADTNWIKPGSVPFFAAHSENDGTVPYSSGKPLSVSSLPTLYGSFSMDARAKNVGVEDDFYSYSGTSHPPYAGSVAKLDSIIEYTAQFLYKYLPCNKLTAVPSYFREVEQLQVYPNPSTGFFTVNLNGLPDHDKVKTVETFNTLGEKVASAEIIENQFKLALSSLPPGLYMVKVQNSNGTILGSKAILIEK